MSKWVGGLAEWQEGDTVYLSVAFTWKLNEAWERAVFARSQGWKVRAGGPALFLIKMQHKLVDVAQVGGDYHEAVTKHNPMATFASRGCNQTERLKDGNDCRGFCIVPHMEGEFRLIPDFTPRPILCDNNLSALPTDYQDFIIRRYQEAGVPLLDANSGFEPHSFSPDVYKRWKPLVNAGRGPWRFGYDDLGERESVHAVMRMLRDEPARRKRVYVLIGKEPFAACMQRIQEVVAGGCEPQITHDWTAQLLTDVARWANRFGWRSHSFDSYRRSFKSRAVSRYDEQQGLFV